MVAEIVVASGIPNASIYPGVIMVVIVITVVISAIGIPVFTRAQKKRKKE